jgi:aminopeptidase N
VVVVAGHPQRAESRLEPDRDTLTLRLPQPIGPGDAQLRVTYTGVLTRELRGFYLSEANGRKYAMTQLEATDARRMVLSFDEPALKATFQISSSILIPRLMRFNVTVDF